MHITFLLHHYTISTSQVPVSTLAAVYQETGAGSTGHGVLMEHGSYAFKTEVVKRQQARYLELATELLHQRVAVQHHAGANLLSHACQSAQVVLYHNTTEGKCVL